MPRPQRQSPAERRRIFQQAFELARVGRFDDADAMVRTSAAKPAKDADGLRVRAQLAMLAGNPGEAMALIDRSLKIESTAAAWLVRADLRLRMDQVEEGVAAALEAVSSDPEDPEVRIQAATVLLRVRRRNEADTVIAPLVADPPDAPGTHRRYLIVTAAIAIQDGRAETAIEPLRTVLESATLPPERRAAMELLAHALERTGRHDEAFTVAAECHALAPTRFDPDRHAATTDRIIETMDRTSMSRFPAGCQDERPVFVAGMPRSGTSLVDRIVDAHPEAVGIGELPLLERVLVRGLGRREIRPILPEDLTSAQCEDWSDIAAKGIRIFDEVAPGATRVLGKSLGNPPLLGIAAALYPRCRILHVVRDPRDVAISCHFGRFRADAIPYATRLEWVAAVWRDTERLMKHWSRELDVPMVTIRYEDLVTRPETEVPRLLEFLDLPPDERCLSFHESDRPLQTLSVDQVARPFHTESVGRHRRHAARIETVDWPAG